MVLDKELFDVYSVIVWFPSSFISVTAKPLILKGAIMGNVDHNFKQCILCDSPSDYIYNGADITMCICTCPVCGEFYIARDFLFSHYSVKHTLNQRHILSGICRNTFDQGGMFSLHSRTYNQVIDTGGNYTGLIIPQSPDEMIQLILHYYVNRLKYPNDRYNFNINSDYSLFFCHDTLEFRSYLTYLTESGFISLSRVKVGDDEKDAIRISVKGWQFVFDTRKRLPDSDLCFVAMRIDSNDTELETLFDDAIVPAILEAGYRPHRIDRAAAVAPRNEEKVDDRIIADIKKAAFMVADFTGQRQCVYYEAGFAKGLGMQVIRCCKQDDVSNLHFDTRNLPHIIWETDKLEDFKERLKFNILAEIGQGTHTQNVRNVAAD